MAKLTAKQQEVVDKMRDGWKLESTRDSFGGRMKGYLILKAPDGRRQDWLNRGLLNQLNKKGVVTASRSIDWLTTEYVLTERGRP